MSAFRVVFAPDGSGEWRCEDCAVTYYAAVPDRVFGTLATHIEQVHGTGLAP